MKKQFLALLIGFLVIVGCTAKGPTDPSGNNVAATPTPVPVFTATPTPTVVYIPVTITYLTVSPSNASIYWQWAQYPTTYAGITPSTPVSVCSYSTTVVQAPYASGLMVTMSDTQPSGPTTCASQLIVSTPWNGPVTDNGVNNGTGMWNATITITGVGQIGAPVSAY
jgi:hypothetical protein